MKAWWWCRSSMIAWKSRLINWSIFALLLLNWGTTFQRYSGHYCNKSQSFCEQIFTYDNFFYIQSNNDLTQSIADHQEWLNHLSERVETLHMNTSVFVQVKTTEEILLMCIFITNPLKKNTFTVYSFSAARWIQSLVPGQGNRFPNTATAWVDSTRLMMLSQSLAGLQSAHEGTVTLPLKCPATGDAVDCGH